MPGRNVLFRRGAARIHFQNSVEFLNTSLQELLSESISLIAKSDYPDHCTSFIARFGPSPPNPIERYCILNGFAQDADSIFKAFRYVESSDELYPVHHLHAVGIHQFCSLPIF
jgi:hypothetical protein